MPRKDRSNTQLTCSALGFVFAICWALSSPSKGHVITTKPLLAFSFWPQHCHPLPHHALTVCGVKGVHMCGGQGILADIFLILFILPLLLVWRMPVWLICLARESRDLPLSLSLPPQCWNLSLSLTLGFGLTFLGTDLKSLQNKLVNLLRCVLTDFWKVGTYNHLYLVYNMEHQCTNSLEWILSEQSLILHVWQVSFMVRASLVFSPSSFGISNTSSLVYHKFSFLLSASSHIYSHHIKWPMMKQLLGNSIHQTSEAGVFTESRGVPCQKIFLIP